MKRKNENQDLPCRKRVGKVNSLPTTSKATNITTWTPSIPPQIHLIEAQLREMALQMQFMRRNNDEMLRQAAARILSLESRIMHLENDKASQRQDKNCKGQYNRYIY